RVVRLGGTSNDGSACASHNSLLRLLFPRRTPRRAFCSRSRQSRPRGGQMSGTWQSLKNTPTFSASTAMLLTDGTVMCQDGGGAAWWKLTPDATGDYVNGTWSPLASMHNSRLYYTSAVLRDGRVLLAGGEYSDAGSETNKVELYYPTLDLWVQIASPAGWAEVGDAPCCTLPDGRVLMGSIESNETAIFDPVSETWSAGPNKDDSSSEETWVLLGDETVL